VGAPVQRDSARAVSLRSARAHRDRSVAMSSASPKPASPKAAAITVENPLMDAPPLSAAAEEAKEEAEVETEEQFEQELQMAHTQAESPRVEGRRKERDMSEEERTHLEARFRSCFDAMDVNEDGVIMNDPDDEELVRDAGLAALSHRAARVPLSLAPLLLRKLLRKLLLPQPPPLG
jgi:hypothetical protein